MAVFCVERTRDYTVMSNYHLRDKALSLKSKGLLSQMLSLPEDWDYTLAGLSLINKESKDAIRTAINELENAGYIIRRQTTDLSGRFAGNEYIIYESPTPSPENPTTAKPTSEKPTQLNIDILKTEKSNTNSLLSAKSQEECRQMIRKNIEYNILCKQMPHEVDMLNELVELMAETVSAKRQYTRVAGSSFPHEEVKMRLLKLNSQHIEFVMDCMRQNTSKVKNIKQYLLTALFNAPTTISNYYASLVNHDMHGAERSSYV